MFLQNEGNNKVKAGECRGEGSLILKLPAEGNPDFGVL